MWILREERRSKKQRKKPTETQKIPINESSGTDRWFEDIEKDKANKYVGNLYRDDDFIRSSDFWSDDSKEELDT